MSLLDNDIYKQAVGAVQSEMAESTVATFFRLAERELQRRIGKELYDYLMAETPTDSVEAARYAELKELAQGWASWYAHSLAFPHMKFRIGDLGMMKNAPQNAIAVTKWEYVDSANSNLEMQDIFLELFFEALEADAPSVWQQSEAYISRQQHFIRSASELSTFLPIAGRNSRFFERLKVYIARSEELYIEELLTSEVFDGLKTKWIERNEFSPVEKKLVNLIQQAVAHLAVFEAYPYLPLTIDEEGVRQSRSKDGIREEEFPEGKLRNTMRRQLYADGELYIGKLKRLMDKTATTTLFPTYYEKYFSDLSEEQEEDFTDSPHIIL